MCDTQCVLYIVLRSRCEDSNHSMLVAHVRTRTLRADDQRYLRRSKADTVGALDMSVSPRRSDIDNILRGSANRSSVGMLGRRCLVVCRNDESLLIEMVCGMDDYHLECVLSILCLVGRDII